MEQIAGASRSIYSKRQKMMYIECRNLTEVSDGSVEASETERDVFDF